MTTTLTLLYPCGCRLAFDANDVMETPVCEEALRLEQDLRLTNPRSPEFGRVLEAYWAHFPDTTKAEVTA